jgi:hypothetical protein
MRLSATLVAALAPLKGKVAEKIDASPYTYLRLTTATGDAWAAVPETSIAVGTDVEISHPLEMKAFESKSLHRTFEVIYFGSLLGDAAPAPAAAAAAPMAEPVPTIRVEKASGSTAHTVAEIWSQKDALKDAPVAVRGQVVKVNVGILGLNWIHLHDGSGRHDDGSDDITVTTKAELAAPGIGDVVTATGVVHTARDFGAGYTYPVMVEDATLAK